MDTIKLLFVEPNGILARLLSQVALNAGGLELVGLMSNVIQTLGFLECTRPEIVVMDVLLPDMGVVEAIALALEKAPSAKIVLLTDHDQARYYQAALPFGASACLSKERIATELIPLVKQIAHQARRTKALGHTMRAHRGQSLVTIETAQKPEIFHTSKEISGSNVPAQSV